MVSRGVCLLWLCGVQSRVGWAQQFLQQSVYINPVLDNITLSGLGLPLVPAAVANTDLVVIMTASPEPVGSIFEAYATCIQRDQVRVVTFRGLWRRERVAPSLAIANPWCAHHVVVTAGVPPCFACFPSLCRRRVVARSAC